MSEGSATHAVRARACCRVDLAGGTLDIWPLGLLHEGARTVNVAVDVVAEVAMRRAESCSVVQGEDAVEARDWREIARREEAALIGLLAVELELPALAIEVSSGSPRGGGLGASSALGVALVAAGERILGRPSSPPERVSTLIRDVEARLMGLPTGRQDQWAALLGGALEIVYRPGAERVDRLDVDLEALAGGLVVAYTGRSHFSAGNNWQVVRRRLDGESESVALFEGIAAAAVDAAAALRAGDLEALGRACDEEWRHRRRLAEGVSTPEIERLLEAARSAGAWGGKATGAGGGGCVAVLCPADRRERVERAVAGAGGRVLSARPSGEAVRVVDPAEAAAWRAED